MVGEEAAPPRVELAPHANERMVERGWKFKDVKKAIFDYERRYQQPGGRLACEKTIKGRRIKVIHNPLQDNKILVITVMTVGGR